MKQNLCIFLFCFLNLLPTQAWESALLKREGGKLVYYPDADGFIIPDFSYAGYKMGEQPLPTVPVLESISPIQGDNTAHIQAAINRVGAKPLGTNGIRGALLLRKGRYRVEGTLKVNFDGVVLRGEGNDDNTTTSTIVEGWGNTPHQRDLIVLGNNSKNYWNLNVTDKVNITTPIVNVGSRTFTVSDASKYRVGDQVVIEHPCTPAWIEAVNLGGVTDPAEIWREGQLPILYNRYISDINGNEITLHAPFFYRLNQALSSCTMAHYDKKYYLQEIGIENLRVKILSDGGEDENHTWQAIRFKTVENCWANNVVTEGFGQSGFITEGAIYSTILNCQAIDPVSIITGERRYNFNCYVNSQFILFKDCYARNGRHHYTSNGTSSVSGIVFTNCVSDASNSNCEPHRQWSQGILYDRYQETNLKRFTVGVLGLYNRGNSGTGHGWAAANSFLWNCDITNQGMAYLQKPPTSQNYAIGLIAKTIEHNKPNAAPLGYVEGHNRTGLEPASLYEAQLTERTSVTSINRPTTRREFRIVVPNHSDTAFVLFDGETHNTLLRLFNTKGENIWSQKINTNNRIDLSPLANGVYLGELQTPTITYSTKFRIQR